MWSIFLRFGDLYGGRAALILAFASSSVSYGILGFADSISMLFLSRLPSLYMHAMQGRYKWKKKTEKGRKTSFKSTIEEEGGWYGRDIKVYAGKICSVFFWGNHAACANYAENRVWEVCGGSLGFRGYTCTLNTKVGDCDWLEVSIMNIFVVNNVLIYGSYWLSIMKKIYIFWYCNMYIS